MTKEGRAKSFLNIISELGYELAPKSRILDLGCGSGEMVKEYRGLCFEAFGSDIKPHDHREFQDMQKKGIICISKTNPYRLTFKDDSFDLVCSDNVFEHIIDYPTVLKEIYRVLKPGGISLHIFPSRYRIVECHTGIPLGSIIKKRWWLSLWARLGIRNKYQKGSSAKETVERNYNYIHNHTNYLNKSDIRKTVCHFFGNITDCEKAFLKFGKRTRLIYNMSHTVSFIPALYGIFRNRVIFFKK